MIDRETIEAHIEQIFELRKTCKNQEERQAFNYRLLELTLKLNAVDKPTQ